MWLDLTSLIFFYHLTLAGFFFGFLFIQNFSDAAKSIPIIATLHLSRGDVTIKKVSFINGLVKRALEVTVVTDGPFEIIRTPPITSKRVRLWDTTYKNIVT